MVPGFWLSVPEAQGDTYVYLFQLFGCVFTFNLFSMRQMLPRGRVYRYPPGRGLPDVSMPGMGGGMQLRGDAGGMSKPIPIGALASALANSTPAEQRTVCTLTGLFM